MASLLVLKGPNQGTRIAIEKEKVILGRNGDCDVVINVHAVSWEHARILLKEGQYFIEDLRSRNGTAVNSQQIETETPFPLHDNDKIKICDFLCSFHQPERKPLPKDLLAETEEEEDEG